MESRPRVGTRIKPRDSWNLLDRDILAWRFASLPVEELVEDLLEVRRIIEPMAAGLAAERGRLERVSEIENAYWQMEAAGDNTEESIGPDIRFHQAILEASGNELLVPLGAVIAAALESSIKLSSSTPGVQIKSLPFHKSILDAIKQRDPPGARRAMERLLSETVADIDAELRSGRNRANTMKETNLLV